jgi:catechol 2,3-dioxygenase
VRDLSRSREFYTQVLGLVVSDEDRDTLYLRGVEERSHHSLVLKRTSAPPACIRTGLRTYDEEDLEKARFLFASRGLPAEFGELPYQSRALSTFDSSGTPLELCASMSRVERVDGVFLHVKDTPYDVVFIRRSGPALHHFACIVSGINDIIRSCDVAGSLGCGDNVEFGPGGTVLGTRIITRPRARTPALWPGY